MDEFINDHYWVGTDLKFAIEITADGFDMDDDDYSIVLRCGLKTMELTKSDIVEGGNGEHLLLVDTTQFPSGTLRMVVYAKVPDEDYDSNVRREVAVKDLCIIKHPL